MKLLKQLSEWVAKRDICHNSFQDMLEATPDHVAHTYIIRDIFIAGYLIFKKIIPKCTFHFKVNSVSVFAKCENQMQQQSLKRHLSSHYIKFSAVFKGLWMAAWNPRNPLYLFGINVQIFLSKSQYLKAITWKNFHQQKTWFCKSEGSGITKIDIIGFAYVNANLQLAL